MGRALFLLGSVALDHVLARGHFLTSPVTPVIQRVCLAHRAIAKHKAIGATVWLEDAATEEDVSQTEHGNHQEAEVVQPQDDAVARAEIEHGGAEQEQHARDAHLAPNSHSMPSAKRWPDFTSPWSGM